MHISDFIARRYLFAKKSHNVINIISIISAVGIAVGCAALVIILSIYNGFDEVVRSLGDAHTADLVVTPKEGKVFSRSARHIDALQSNTLVEACCGILEENVYVKYADRTAVVTARGVDSAYIAATGLKDYIVSGEFSLRQGEIPQAVVGRTIALNLRLNIAFLTPLEVYFPSRTAGVDIMSAAASLRKADMFPSGIISLEQSFDGKYIFVQKEILSSLLEYDDEVSCVEIYLAAEGLDSRGMALRKVQQAVEEEFGEDFTVRNRREQNETLYKLLIYEKTAIYLILLFIIIIISFNIFSSLSMLIIEKKEDTETLRAMGADEAMVRRIFVREGWLISLLGIAAGVIAGLAVCFLQQRLGIVKMPGNFVIDAYPVVIQWQDIVLTVAGVGLVGYLVSLLVKK